MWTYCVHMKTATVRDLRNNFSKLETWLAEGEEIRIEKRGQPVAMLRSLSGEPEQKKTIKTDWAARRKKLWGDRVFSEQEVKEMREAEYGQYER